MPTSAIVTYGGLRVEPVKAVEESHLDVIKLVNGTYAAGTLVGEVTASPGTYKAYTSGASDGSQIPSHVLEYPVIVSSSKIYLGDTVGGELQIEIPGAPAWRNGLFDIADLVGYDATAAVNGKFRIMGNGRVAIPG